MSGPIAQIALVPGQAAASGEDGSKIDPLALLLDEVSKARGGAVTLENLAESLGEGGKSYDFARLGPMPPEVMEKIRAGAFNSVLASRR